MLRLLSAASLITASLAGAALSEQTNAPPPSSPSKVKVETITAEDDYYYGHKRVVELPVYRITLSDPEQTRVYVGEKSGEVRQLADGTTQRYRWALNAMHNLDLAFMRGRPVWDIVTLLLLAVVTIACATGAWMSFTRIGTDVSRLREMLKRK